MVHTYIILLELISPINDADFTIRGGAGGLQPNPARGTISNKYFCETWKFYL